MITHIRKCKEGEKIKWRVCKFENPDNSKIFLRAYVEGGGLEKKAVVQENESCQNEYTGAWESLGWLMNFVEPKFLFFPHLSSIKSLRGFLLQVNVLNKQTIFHPTWNSIKRENNIEAPVSRLCLFEIVISAHGFSPTPGYSYWKVFNFEFNFTSNLNIEKWEYQLEILIVAIVKCKIKLRLLYYL